MARGGVQDLPRAGTLPTAKASRHGARAKGFAPRRNTPHGEGRPTRRTSERVCPAQERSPRRRPPDTAHEQKNLPRGSSPSPRVPTNGGPLPTDEQPEKHPFGGVAPTARAAAAEFIHRKKIRLLHEIQLFYGESHVGSRQIFSSFPSVDRCVARERNPVPPFAPHCGRGHRGLRRDGEMHHGFGEMVRRFGECPHGCESLPRGGNGWPRSGGRYYPGLRCFGERFHRRRCANPDAFRGRRCSRGHNDLGRRAFRSSRPTFRNRRRSGEKNFRGPRCSHGHDDLGQRAFRYFRPAFRHRRRSGEKTCHGRRCSRAHDNLGQRAFRYFRSSLRNPLCDNEKNFDDDGRPLGRTASGGGGGGCGAALGRRPHGALHAVARPASADGARAREATHVFRGRTRRRLPNGGAAPARTPR